MCAFPRVLLCCLLLLLQAVSTAKSTPITVPSYFQKVPLTRREIPVEKVRRELGSRLAPGSTIFGPDDAAFSTAIIRWNLNGQTDIKVVVRPARESDVARIIDYCNDNSIDFLPYSGGKGLTTSLKTFSGLQIDMYQLRAITINKAGMSARAQAGARMGEIINILWAKGYVAAIGSNGCVGIAGLGLGGGYGRLMGQYGLVSDNFISLNTILANGSQVVVSDKSHKDLFWAMKGAGHNFGFVTSRDIRIYKRQNRLWHYHNYIFARSQLEKSGFAYNSPVGDAKALLEPFNQIDNLWEESGDVPYPDILTVQQTDAASPACNPAPWAGCATGLQVYSLTTERQNYNLYRETLARYPKLASGSRLYYEGYSMKTVQAVDSAPSAFPFRSDNHLVFFLAVTLPGLEKQAQALADGIRNQWHSGQPNRKPSTYVNYAFGYEPLEWMYGHEPWRLEKLRRLKRVYDPSNRFRFHNPIIQG